MFNTEWTKVLMSLGSKDETRVSCRIHIQADIHTYIPTYTATHANAHTAVRLSVCWGLTARHSHGDISGYCC